MVDKKVENSQSVTFCPVNRSCWLSVWFACNKPWVDLAACSTLELFIQFAFFRPPRTAFTLPLWEVCVEMYKCRARLTRFQDIVGGGASWPRGDGGAGRWCPLTHQLAPYPLVYFHYFTPTSLLPLVYFHTLNINILTLGSRSIFGLHHKKKHNYNLWLQSLWWDLIF